MLKRVMNINDKEYLDTLQNRSSFTRNELIAAMRECGLSLSESSFKIKLQELISSALIIRVGRNAYCVTQGNVRQYRHNYSELAENVAERILSEYPDLKYSIFETVQLNEFVNHQLAHNIVFVQVENGFSDFVFNSLKELHPGKVLLHPTPDAYHQYWYSNMIVITKLVSESPTNKSRPWAARLEKILVDIMADSLILSTISISEYPVIFSSAFQKYVIDESCLFRYARRRGVDEKILRLIDNETEINLRTRRVSC